MNTAEEEIRFLKEIDMCAIMQAKEQHFQL